VKTQCIDRPRHAVRQFSDSGKVAGLYAGNDQAADADRAGLLGSGPWLGQEIQMAVGVYEHADTLHLRQ